jgi:opacity protein-like surface antigen
MRMIMIAAALGATAATTAHAEPYGKLFGGVGLGTDHDLSATLLDDDDAETLYGEYDTDLGYVVGGAYGYNLSRFLSVEGEVAYRSNNVSSAVIDDEDFEGDGDLTSLSFMGNAILSAPGAAGFAPYAGAGAGLARIGGEGDHDFTFAYQVFGGVSKTLSERLSAAVEYRYLDANEATLVDGDVAVKTEYDSHSVNLVLKRTF